MIIIINLQGHIDAQSLPSPTTQSSSSGLVPGSTKYSRLATNGSPSHGRVGGGVSGYVATSTQELIQQQIRQQEQLVLHQDSQLSQMSQSVGTLRNVSTAIGSELDEQAVMLDEFGAEIEQAETKLDATMRKMVGIHPVHSVSNRLYTYFLLTYNFIPFGGWFEIHL